MSKALQENVKQAMEMLSGTALEVFKLVMLEHPGTGSSSLLAHVFVGLATEKRVRLFNPCRLDRTNYQRLINLMDEAAFGTWGWSEAASLIAGEYDI